MLKFRPRIIFSKKIIHKFFIFFVIFSFLINTISPVLADPTEVSVGDKKGTLATIWQKVQDAALWAEDWAKTAAQVAYDKAGSILYHQVLRTALNTVAYDLATEIASGGDGQTPSFMTEGWGEYLANIADNAAGQFIEGIGDELGMDLCNPSLDVKLKIGLGLVEYERPEVDCSFSEMRDNWDSFVNNAQFFEGFGDMFDPTSNYLGVSLDAYTNLYEAKEEEEQQGIFERMANNGWLDVENIAGRKESPPGYEAGKMETASDIQTQNLAQTTDDPFTDAANVFLNTLALQLFQRLLSTIGSGQSTYTTPYEGDYGGLLDADSQFSYGGMSAAKERLKEITQPKFDELGDFEILASLTTCPDPTKAGPDECVIDNNFSEAIINKNTIAESIANGYLKADNIFGFIKGSSLEPDYNQGYPYRSMIILRKYRILPIGWEIGAQYIKENITDRSLTLGDMINCFDDNDEYVGYNEDWCRGLVNPDWVLKAPKNYCQRAGYGPSIFYKEVVGTDEEASIKVSREDDYCADEKSCIKEKDDGSCEYYGYCTEDKPTWNFKSDSCQAEYNTCQTFTDTSGKTISYLKNTLDYSSCADENAGCTAYAKDGEYTDGDIVWNATGAYAYFNRQAETCDDDSEGCQELIRTKDGMGVNLLINGDFEEDASLGGWNSYGIPVENSGTEISHNGLKSFKLNQDMIRSIEVGPSDYDIYGNKYILSFYAKNCGDGTYGIGDSVSIFYNTSDWSLFQIGYTFPSDATGNTVEISLKPSDISNCRIDDIKFEKGFSATSFSEYGVNGAYYQKLIPPYLESACYVSGTDHRLAADAPDVCQEYARKCNKDEEGCNLFSSEEDELVIPAKATALDYCPSECDGFATYIQRETNFEEADDTYFIPKTAKNCSATYVGCEEFTNLDEVNQGAENKEYYSYLRQCVKKSDPDCAEFYVWENTESSGYQLKLMNLKGSSVSGGLEPITTEDTSAECSEAIFNKPASDPAYNADCRQFYDKSGHISYKLYSKTVSCSDDCHPFRLSDSGSGTCKGGGVWSTQHNACIYSAIPSEGTKCSAAQVGCREYSGNAGNNMEVIFTDDFESSSTDPWLAVSNVTSLEVSSESVMTGGHSMYVQGDGNSVISRVYSGTDDNNAIYNLIFIAKTEGNSIDMNAYLDYGDGIISNEAEITVLNNQWLVYRASFEKPAGVGSLYPTLVIKANGSSYFIDNIKIVEIPDHYYKIKNSWATPDSCNRDQDGNIYPLYALGCRAYSDLDDEIHYLRSFSNLCQESSAGCEVMINTHNTDSPISETHGNITIPKDNYEYIVYSPDMECEQEMKGCRMFGEAYTYDNKTIFSDVYLLDNPDKYDTVLCSSDAVGCEEWQSDEGVSYFKNPYYKACEWRKIDETSDSYSWLKVEVKRCDANKNGEIDTGTETTLCSADKDCGTDIDCIYDENDYDCPTSYLKTFGTGGTGNMVYQPKDGWAGICTVESSGCSEYIDPISQPSTNVIFNPNYSTIAGVIGAGWTNGVQDVEIDQRTLYVLEGEGASVLSCKNRQETASPIYVLDSDNKLVAANSASVDSSGTLRFLSDWSYVCKISGGAAGKTISLRKAMIGYRLNDEIDTSSCNNLVDQGDGCVLFNERAQVGANPKPLIYDAKASYAAKSPQSGSNANRLIKVQPNRVCSEWLACRSLAEIGSGDNKENACYDIGACDRINDSGQCISFVRQDKDELAINSGNISRYANLTGYTKSGYDGIDDDSMKAMYPTGAMEQIGEVANVPNGSFEDYNDEKFPNGWMTSCSFTNGCINSSTGNDNWTADMFSVIDSPVDSETELGSDSKYPVEGKAFLKYSSENNDQAPRSEFIDLEPNIEYALSYYVNTKNLRQKDPQSGYIDNVKARLVLNWGSGNVARDTDSGLDWRQENLVFTPTSRTLQIMLQSKDPAISTGNIYIDDIRIKPVLETRENDEMNIKQSCRLYPKSDSLSCDYYEDTGKYYKGWPGYCLQYDRYPGSPDTCLLWWPIDRVKGDGIYDSGVGYNDKTPLYECAQFASRDLELVEYRKSIQTAYDDCGAGSNKTCSGYGCAAPSIPSENCPNGYSGAHSSSDCGFPAFNSEDWYYCNVSDGWYATDGDFQKFGGNTGSYDEASKGLKLRDKNTGEMFEIDEMESLFYCLEVANLVTPTGQNKAWASRVYSGSEYAVPTLNYVYETFNPPFGSVNPPDPISDPYMWDADETNSGKQPMRITNKENSSEVSAGSPYSCASIAPTAIPNGQACLQAGRCSVTNDFCYEIYIPDPAGAVNPVKDHFTNPFKCSDETGNTCVTGGYPLTLSEGLDLMKTLFAKSYGYWQWDPRADKDSGRYMYDSSRSIWDPPTASCNGTGSGTRPDYPNDYCGIKPVVSNILVNNQSAQVNFSRNGFVNLQFSSTVNVDQLPLVMYSVDWGDGEQTVVSGVDMSDRRNEDLPHSLYHLYDYWDIREKISTNPGAVPVSTCATTANGLNYCRLTPKILLKDNWGWCSSGVSGDPCPANGAYTSFGSSIVVWENSSIY